MKRKREYSCAAPDCRKDLSPPRQRRYCSDTCRFRMQKRRDVRKRKDRELAAQALILLNTNVEGENISELVKRDAPISPKPRRHYIPTPMKYKVWVQTYGNALAVSCCLCHHNVIHPFNFHCGHRIPVCKGGQNTLDNLVAICGPCNFSMGAKLFSEFEKLLQ